ncbi:hypothetical protein SDJN02_18740, partial [Cucurbita argyrosperma subsp. argyrosperma]
MCSKFFIKKYITGTDISMYHVWLDLVMKEPVHNMKDESQFIIAREEVGLSIKGAAGPPTIKAHVSIKSFMRQETFLQLDCEAVLGIMESFHFETLSDHFQTRLFEELNTLPPTQQPPKVPLHMFCAKLNS